MKWILLMLVLTTFNVSYDVLTNSLDVTTLAWEGGALAGVVGAYVMTEFL